MADGRLACGLIVLLLGQAACRDQPATDDAQTEVAENEAPAERQPPEYWASQLDHASPAIRRQALGNLGGYGREAATYAPLMAAFLTDQDDKTGFTAAWALAHTGMGSHPLLIAALESDDPRERERAAYGVGEMGPAGAVAADRLRELMTDPVPAVRNMASWALEQVRFQRMVGDPNLVLTHGLDGSRQERIDAIDRLGVTAPTSRMAVRELIALLGDSVPGIRDRAVQALSQAGPTALPSLSVALSHRNRQIRRGALLAISRMHRVF